MPTVVSAHHRIVIDEQDAAGARLVQSSLGRGRHAEHGRLSAPSATGSHSSTVVPTPRLAVIAHRAARLRGQAVHHREAEPGALAGALGGEERLGRALQRRLVHAGAGVADGDADIIARLPARAHLPGRDALAMRGDRQLPAMRHRIARIEREVEQRQFELVRIDPDRRQIGREVGGDLDRRARASAAASRSCRRPAAATSTVSGRSS